MSVPGPTPTNGVPFSKSGAKGQAAEQAADQKIILAAPYARALI